MPCGAAGYGLIAEYSVNNRIILSEQKRINLSERYRSDGSVQDFLFFSYESVRIYGFGCQEKILETGRILRIGVV